MIRQLLPTASIRVSRIPSDPRLVRLTRAHCILQHCDACQVRHRNSCLLRPSVSTQNAGFRVAPRSAARSPIDNILTVRRQSPEPLAACKDCRRISPQSQTTRVDCPATFRSVLKNVFTTTVLELIFMVLPFYCNRNSSSLLISSGLLQFYKSSTRSRKRNLNGRSQ